MSLKFKRNLPTVFLLVSILSYLAIFMGDQRITSYTVNAESLRAAIQFNVSNEFVQLAAVPSVQTARR